MTYWVYIKVASIQNYWPVHIEVVEVLVCDDVDVSKVNVWAGPRFETGSIPSTNVSTRLSHREVSTHLRVQHRHILNVCVVDIAFDAGILANASHTYSTSAVSANICDEGVRSIGLRTKAVVAYVDPGITNGEAILYESQPSVFLGRFCNR